MPKDRGARHGFAAQPGAKSRFHASAYCEPSICSSIQLTALHCWTPLRCGSRSHPAHFCARIVLSLSTLATLKSRARRSVRTNFSQPQNDVLAFWHQPNSAMG